MTLKEKWILWRHKNRALLVHMYHENGNLSSFVVKLKDDTKDFSHRGQKYSVRYDHIWRTNGIATLSYFENEPSPANPKKWDSISPYTANDLEKMWKSKIVQELLNVSDDGADEIKKWLMVFGAILTGVIGFALYYMYNEIIELNDYIRENQPLYDYIRDQISSGGGLP